MSKVQFFAVVLYLLRLTYSHDSETVLVIVLIHKPNRKGLGIIMPLLRNNKAEFPCLFVYPLAAEQLTAQTPARSYQALEEACPHHASLTVSRTGRGAGETGGRSLLSKWRGMEAPLWQSWVSPHLRGCRICADRVSGECLATRWLPSPSTRRSGHLSRSAFTKSQPGAVSAQREPTEWLGKDIKKKEERLWAAGDLGLKTSKLQERLQGCSH